MRAATTTKLPLARWAQIMGIHPLHVMGVQIPATDDQHCNRAWPEHSWQNADAVSREEVVQAIAAAEAAIEDQLGYRLLPAWEAEEWQTLARPYNPEMVAFGLGGVRGYNDTAVRANWGYLVSGGVRAQTLIASSAPIVYTDVDVDGYAETATVSVATAVTNPQEIAVFYPGKAGLAEWQIRPASVTIAAGTATIVFRRELAVLESALEGWAFLEVLGTDNAKFLTTADIYRVYNDPSQQAALLWEPLGACGCATGGCVACAFGTQTACILSRDEPRLSQMTLTPAAWNATTAQFDSASMALARRPDMVRLWYRAGWRDTRLAQPDIDMDAGLAWAVAVYAASMLDRPPCDCQSDVFERWQADLAFTGGATELATYQLTPRDLDSPFGTRAGALLAWRQLRSRTAHVPVAHAVRL